MMKDECLECRRLSFVIGLLISSRQELYLCQSLLQEAQHYGLVVIQVILCFT